MRKIRLLWVVWWVNKNILSWDHTLRSLFFKSAVYFGLKAGFEILRLFGLIQLQWVSPCLGIPLSRQNPPSPGNICIPCISFVVFWNTIFNKNIWLLVARWLKNDGQLVGSSFNRGKSFLLVNPIGEKMCSKIALRPTLESSRTHFLSNRILYYLK